jgi:hypothetical protein
MSLEARLEALEARLRAAEDHLEILNLLNAYGPLVDSGSDQDAAHLWVEGGGYSYSLPEGGTARFNAPDDLAAVYRSEGHMALVRAGSAHLTATPTLRIEGDHAEAVAYSFVILRENQGWSVWRAAVNHWRLVRTSEGWRIAERLNRVLDGSQDSYEAMRRARALRQSAAPLDQAPSHEAT